MARKRGGLAGFWDKRKNVIVPVLSGAAGVFGGPLAGAAVGSLARGLDKRSLKSALTGGIEGAGAGALGAGLGAKTGIGGAQRAAVKQFLTGGGKAASGATASGMNVGITPGTGGITKTLSEPVMRSQMPPQSFGSRALSFARENKDLLTMAGKGIQQALPDPASDAALMSAETARMRLDEERRQMQVEEERRRRIAELLMPMFRQQFPQYAGS